MSKTILSTNLAPGAIGPYSQGTKFGNMIITSGQLPLNMETGEMATEIKEATKNCLTNVKAILEAAGASMEDVVKTTVFLKDMDLFADMNEVYGTFFTFEPPARSAVQVAKLPKDVLIEIEAIAYKD